MQISLERTGGFAGIARTKTIDTENIPIELAQRLDALLTEVDFFNLPMHIESSSLRPDRFYYSLTITDHHQQHTVSFAETAASEQLKAILNLCNQIPSTQQE